MKSRSADDITTARDYRATRDSISWDFGESDWMKTPVVILRTYVSGEYLESDFGGRVGLQRQHLSGARPRGVVQFANQRCLSCMDPKAGDPPILVWPGSLKNSYAIDYCSLVQSDRQPFAPYIAEGPDTPRCVISAIYSVVRLVAWRVGHRISVTAGIDFKTVRYGHCLRPHMVGKCLQHWLGRPAVEFGMV